MASNRNYLEYVLELLREVSGISYLKMMGEYVLKKNNVVFGGVYDNRFLVKKTKTYQESDFKEVIPYKNAKAMLLIDIEDEDEIKEIVNNIYLDLKNK